MQRDFNLILLNFTQIPFPMDGHKFMLGSLTLLVSHVGIIIAYVQICV